MAKRSKSGRKGTRVRDAAGKRTELRVGNRAHAAAVDQGMQMMNAGDLEGARAKFRSVLDVDMEHPPALHGMGLLASRMGKVTIGIELIRRAIQADPEDAAFHNNLGTILEDQEEYEEALEHYKKTVKLAPRNPAGYNNVASVMARLDRNADALGYAREAVRLAPNEAGVLLNYATVLADVGAFPDAEPYFKKAIELAPEFPQAHFNYSLHLLNHGRWEDAWPHYDWRFRSPGLRSAPRYFPQPVWNGREFRDSKVIFWAEQGIGDEIWFSSMLPDAIALGGEVIVECAPRLVSLFQRSFPSVEIHPFRYLDAEQGRVPIDNHCPFGTLGRFMRRSWDAFPESGGWLIPDPKRLEACRARLAEIGPGPYIGLCWRRPRGRVPGPAIRHDRAAQACSRHPGRHLRQPSVRCPAGGTGDRRAHGDTDRPFRRSRSQG